MTNNKNPLFLKDVVGNKKVIADIEENICDCFNYRHHSCKALENVYIITNDRLEKNNIFGIYSQTNTFIGITGLFDSDNELFKDLTFLRWTGIKIDYRGLKLSHYIIDLLKTKALEKSKSILVVIAHTDLARDYFISLGFKLIKDNDALITKVLNILEEDNGTYVLTLPIKENFNFDWSVLKDS